ncbi:MAG: CoA transferase, partial [Candidatus Bathyarchaeia archaeon]
TMTRDEAVNYFEEVGLPIAPVYYASEATKDPHVLARDMLVEVDQPKMGRIKVVNFPVKMSETPGEVVSAAPLLGQHNKEILTNYLGLTEDEVDQLIKSGVIAQGT